MTHRILKLFRWQFHLDDKYGPHSLVWRKNGYRGVTVHEMWSADLFGRKSMARLVHLGITLFEARLHTAYNAEYHEAHMHTA